MEKYPWLEAERIYAETHEHIDYAEREITNYLKRGWNPESIRGIDGYSGHMYAGVYLKNKRVTVKITGRGEKSFSLDRILSSLQHEEYQPKLFAI